MRVIAATTGIATVPQEGAGAHTVGTISSRIERLPFSFWHVRCLAVVGAAHLFDAFDALTIAFVLPLLVNEWHLTPVEAGLTISAGYVGQSLGAIALGAAAERFGRLRALRWALAILSTLSLVSAFAWGAGIFALVRFVQGIGLGGEVPVAATYINEICPARIRGRLVLSLQTIFGVGVLLTAIAAVRIVPHAGWRAMFLIGGLPVLLAVLLPRLVPESPRWLVGHGRPAEADGIVSAVETAIVAAGGSLRPSADAPNSPSPRATRPVSLVNLLQDGYAPRTLLLWTLALCASIAGFGIASWMPTLYTTIYKLPIELALRFALETNFAGVIGVFLSIALIDQVGRRGTFVIGFGGACVPLLYLWRAGLGVSPGQTMILSAISTFFLSMPLSAIYVYAPELYPTRIRALGAGGASAWLRIGLIVGPIAVGVILPSMGITSVFLLFGGAALLGAVTMLVFGSETRGKALDEIAPPGPHHRE